MSHSGYSQLLALGKMALFSGVCDMTTNREPHESDALSDASLQTGKEPPFQAKKHLSSCFDVYELPSGDSLLFAKDDYRMDCISALVTNEGDILGLAFSFKLKDGIEEGTHKFANGARGILRKGERSYLYLDATGGITNINLKHPIL